MSPDPMAAQVRGESKIRGQERHVRGRKRARWEMQSEEKWRRRRRRRGSQKAKRRWRVAETAAGGGGDGLGETVRIIARWLRLAQLVARLWRLPSPF